MLPKQWDFIYHRGNAMLIHVLIPGSENEGVPGENNQTLCGYRVQPRKSQFNDNSRLLMEG